MRFCIKTLNWKIFLLVMIVGLGGVFALGAYFQTNRQEVKADTCPATKQEAPEDIVKRLCEEAGIGWLKCFRIVDYESGWDVHFDNPMKDGSLDRGLWAINSKQNPEVTFECAFDPICSTNYFISEVEAGNAKKWLSIPILGIKL